MSQETNEFENGPVGEADSDSIQSPPSPENPFESAAEELSVEAGETETLAIAASTATATATQEQQETGTPDDEPFETYKPETGDHTYGDTGAQVPPAPVGPRRLVRDPYSRLGGVASGVAHYYGVDTVLVRLLFVAFVLFTGFGILLYFLAWLLIPRAEYWPPTPPKGGTRAGLDNRQIALGLVGFGVLVAAFATGGSGSQVLIALGLIGAGVWMFTQKPTPEGQLSDAGPAPGPVGAPTGGTGATGAHGDDEPFVSSYSGGTGYGGGSGPPTTPPPVGGEYAGYPAPQPVSRKRRRIWPLLVFPLLFIVLPLLILASVIALAVFADGSIEVSSDDVDDRIVEVTSVEELLVPVDHGIGSLTVDMSALDVAAFDAYDTPVEVDISSDLGEIVVLLPEDLDVRVEADLDLGEISALGHSSDGISPSLRVGNGDPVVELDLDLDIGSISVRRVDG